MVGQCGDERVDGGGGPDDAAILVEHRTATPGRQQRVPLGQLVGVDHPGADSTHRLEHSETGFGGRSDRHHAVAGKQLPVETLFPLSPHRARLHGQADQTRIMVEVSEHARLAA